MNFLLDVLFTGLADALSALISRIVQWLLGIPV